jgi:hypothetical protein
MVPPARFLSFLPRPRAEPCPADPVVRQRGGGDHVVPSDKVCTSGRLPRRQQSSSLLFADEFGCRLSAIHPASSILRTVVREQPSLVAMACWVSP